MNVSSAFVAAFLKVTYEILDFYIWAIIISAGLSWLVALNVINTRNRFVVIVGDFLFRITEPLLQPIRRVLPTMGGLDLSPLALIFIINFLQYFIRYLVL